MLTTEHSRSHVENSRGKTFSNGLKKSLCAFGLLIHVSLKASQRASLLDCVPLSLLGKCSCLPSLPPSHIQLNVTGSIKPSKTNCGRTVVYTQNVLCPYFGRYLPPTSHLPEHIIWVLSISQTHDTQEIVHNKPQGETEKEKRTREEYDLLWGLWLHTSSRGVKNHCTTSRTYFITLCLQVFCRNISLSSMCVPGVSEDQKKVSDPLDCSYRWLWVTMLGLKTELKSFERAASVSNRCHLPSPSHTSFTSLTDPQ